MTQNVTPAVTPVTKTSTPAASTPNLGAEDDPDEVAATVAEDRTSEPGDTPAAAPTTEVSSAGRDGEIQILELHSHNPIISYQNEVYSCTWSDMIGTNLFFGKHDDEADALRSTDEYDLLGTSRIKLIGRKAKITDKPGKRGAYKNTADDIQDEGIDLMSGKSLGNLRFGNATINRDIKKQAKFLERLMDAKRAKGETDNVRTVFKPRGAPSPRKIKGLGKRVRAQDNEDASQEIEELNRRVVRGDANALMRLQEIYSALEDQAGDGGTPQTPATG